jgi:hypothetical protein
LAADPMSDSKTDFGAGQAPRFALHRVGRVVFQRWFDAPERGDAMRVIQWVGSERRTAGSDLALVEVVSAQARRPSQEVVSETISIVRGYKFIRRHHLVVIEGEGLDRRLARGIFATMTFLVGETLESSSTAEDAVARACAAVDQDANETMKSLDALGVLRAT